MSSVADAKPPIRGRGRWCEGPRNQIFTSNVSQHNSPPAVKVSLDRVGTGGTKDFLAI